MNESDTVDHIMSCKQPASFRGERFVPLEGEQMKTTAKKEVVEEEKPNKLMKNLTSFVKNTGSELAKLAKSMEEEDEADAQFVCMICGKKLSAEKMQNHTKHCKVPKGFKGSQFMVFESDEMRMKQQEEKPVEEKPVEEAKPAAVNPFDAASESEEESGNPFGAPEEKKEEKPVAVNPFDAASESEEEGGNPFGAPEEEKEEEKKPEEKKPEEKPVEEKKPVAVSPFDAPSEEEKEEKPAATNPFDAASESEEESGNPFGAPEEKEEEKIEEKPAEKEKEEAANPFNAASESEEEQEEKMDLKMRFGLNSLMKNATKSFARLTKSMEEEDEADAQFVCMICGKKLSAEKMQNHTKHCKVPKGFKGSQFMVFESDEMRMKQQEEKPVEEKPVEEAKPAAVNPFDAASESEEESGNPFGAPEEKKEEKPVAVNPFDAASESEEEGGNPFGAPEKEEEKPAAANPFDAPSKEEDAEPAALEPMPNTPNFLSKQKKQKSIFNLFRREGNERKGVSGNIFSSLTQSITSTVSNIVNVAETEEEAQARLAREEEERIKREEAERKRREEEERLRKEREEAERKRREEEERLRKKAMMEQKLTAGIACKKYCSRGKPHPTTVSLITHASKGQMVGVVRRGEA